MEGSYITGNIDITHAYEPEIQAGTPNIAVSKGNYVQELKMAVNIRRNRCR